MFSISPRPVRIPVITPLLERRNSGKKSPKVRKKFSDKPSFFSRKLSWRSSNKWKPNWRALGAPEKAKEWDVFTKDLKALKEWLEEASQFTQSWRAPEHNIVSIRTQLERHLAFALEVKTHQYQSENVLSRGRGYLDSYPQLGEVLEEELAEVETRWGGLDSHLGIQSKQIQEALAVVETSIGSSSLQDADVEQIQDTLDHMTLRLIGHHSGLPGVEETHNSTAYSEKHSALNIKSSQLAPCSSSPDFEALYSDLNDWLDDMQLAVTDSNDVFISEPQKEQMCQGYEQELQLREVSRSKLQRKGLQLMQTSNQNLAEQVRSRLESLNGRWHTLQSKLLSPIKVARGGSGNTGRKDSTGSIFTTSEEATSVVLEVGDVIGRLRGWVTTMEGRLFASQGTLDSLSHVELEEKKAELEGLQGDIERHTPGIEMVLTLCDLLMADAADVVTKKGQDNLKLNAFNLDRRWQAIQAQSRDLYTRLETKMAECSQKVEITVEPEHTLEVFTPVRGNGRIQHPWSMAPHRCNPTPSKDDDAVDGFTFRVNDLQRRLAIEELVIAREAFSENDAFSISDTSEVSLGDFDFDDVLPLKNGESHADGDPGPGTPDIVDFEDEIFDKYLEMESALINPASAGVGVSPEDEKKKNDMEFWTVSPRETSDYNLDHEMVESKISDLISFNVGSNNSAEQEGGICDDSTLFSGGEPSDYDDVISELDERELLEYALWDICSSQDEIDYVQDNDVGSARAKPPSCEEAAEAIFRAFYLPPESQCPDEVFECAPSISLTQVTPIPAPQSPPGRLCSEADPDAIPGSPPIYVSEAQPIPIPASQVTHAEVKTLLCQSWPMKASLAHSLSERSPSIENLMMTTTPSISRDIDRFFPSILGQELSYQETKRGLDSLRLNLNLSPSRGSSLRQSREDLGETADNTLLEITDKSLSHMYESLDLITELTSRLATDSLSTSPSSSEDYFSCVSSDIETSSTFEASAPRLLAPDTGCGDIIRKQEVAVRDSEGLFPVLFKSRGDRAHKAGNWPAMQEVTENEHGIDSQSGDQFSHVVSSTARTSTVIAHTQDSAESEWEVYVEALSDISPKIEDTPLNLSLSQGCRMEGSPELCEEVCEDSSKMSAEVTTLGTVEGQGNPVATEELPCTFVNGSEELQVAKQGYMSYVSQLTDSCGDGDLMNYLDSVKLKKCYLWSMAGSGGAEADPQGVCEEGGPDAETKDIENELDSLLLKPGELERKWDLDSQGSEDTDELIEASESLINELKNSDLTGSNGPEGAGDWKDVIVLWLDKNTKNAGTQEMVGTAEAGVQEELADRVEMPLLSCAQDEVDSGRRRLEATDGRDQITQVGSPDGAVQEKPPPSFFRRVVTMALPIQLLLFVYVLLVLLLPCVVETSTGDCYFSLSDNLMMDSHRLGPIINYVRGPPPM